MSESKSIQFEIATPERVLFREEIISATVPTQSGEVTILPDHIPLVSILRPGVIEIRLAKGETALMAVSGGFLEVLKNKIVVLADTAEKAEEISEERIKEARARAEEARQNAKFKDETEFAEITARVEKELSREKALNKWRKLKNLDNK